MNLEKLKLDFYEYLKNIKETEQKDEDEQNNEDTDSLEDFSVFSIYNNMEYFKEYLQDELNLSSEVLYMSLEDLKNLEIENGKVVDKQSEENNQSEEDLSMLDIFNMLIQDEGFKAEYDSDGDGQINSEEFDEFTKQNLNDENAEGESISLDDLVKNSENISEKESMDEIQPATVEGENDTDVEDVSEEGENDADVEDVTAEEGNDNDIEDVSDEEDDIPKAEKSDAVTSSTPVSGGSGGSPYVSSVYNSSGSTSSSSVKNKSVEELEAELVDANSDLTDKQTALSEIQNGTDSVVAPLKEDMEAKLEEYLNALHQDTTTPESEKLAEVTKKIEDNETIKREQEEEKQNLTDTIETETGNIETYQGVADDCDSSIRDLNSHISELENAKSDPEQADNIAELQAQIDAANAEIDALTQQKETALQNKKDAEDRKDKAEQKLAKIEDAILLTDSELTDLESERDDLEAIVFEANPDLAKMKEAYETAKETYISTRESAIAAAKSDIETAQDEVDRISGELTEAREKENDTKYSVTKSSLPSELVKALDAKLGAGFCAKLEQVAKNINCDPADLIGIMYSESGLDPHITNANYNSAGLIQFLPVAAEALGTTTQAISKMSGVEQLDYIEKLFKQWSYVDGKRRINAGDLYTLCFLPARVGQEVLTTSSENYYRCNSPLDADGDGKITKTEMGARVKSKYQEVLNQYGLI